LVSGQLSNTLSEDRAKQEHKHNRFQCSETQWGKERETGTTKGEPKRASLVESGESKRHRKNWDHWRVVQHRSSRRATNRVIHGLTYGKQPGETQKTRGGGAGPINTSRRHYSNIGKSKTEPRRNNPVHCVPYALTQTKGSRKKKYTNTIVTRGAFRALNAWYKGKILWTELPTQESR